MPETLTDFDGGHSIGKLKDWIPQNVYQDLLTQGGLATNDLIIAPGISGGLRNHCSGLYKGDRFFMAWAHDAFLWVSSQEYNQELIDAFAEVVGYKPVARYKESDGKVTTLWDKKDPDGRYKQLEEEGKPELTRLLERGYSPLEIMTVVKEKIENKFKDEPPDVDLKYHSLPFPGGGSVYIDFTAEYLIRRQDDRALHSEDPHYRCNYRWGIRKSFMKEVIESPDDLLKKLFGRVYFFFSKEVMDRVDISIESDIDPDGVFRRVSVDDQIHTFSKKRPDLRGQPLDEVIDMILTGNFSTIK